MLKTHKEIAWHPWCQSQCVFQDISNLQTLCVNCTDKVTLKTYRKHKENHTEYIHVAVSVC